MPTPRCFDAKPKESWGLKPFCPAWPTYALHEEPTSLTSDAVRRALRPFAAGVSAADHVRVGSRGRGGQRRRGWRRRRVHVRAAR